MAIQAANVVLSKPRLPPENHICGLDSLLIPIDDENLIDLFEYSFKNTLVKKILKYLRKRLKSMNLNTYNYKRKPELIIINEKIK